MASYYAYQNGQYIPLNVAIGGGVWSASGGSGPTEQATPDTQFGLQKNPDSANVTPYDGPVYTNGSLFRSGTNNVQAPSPLTSAAANLVSNWNYRPANNYAQYAGTGRTTPVYGRNPLSPFIPQTSMAQKPSASALLATLGNKAAAPKAEGGSVDDILQIFNGLGIPQKAKGGAIRGIGGGQADNVMTTAAPKSFIIPADVVSDLGDGNTDEGHRRLVATWNKVKMACGGTVGYASGGAVNDVPVALSPGEHAVPVNIVNALGGGSNKAGTDNLMNLIKHVRAHKATKKHPPKAKMPLNYMKNAPQVPVQMPKSPLLTQ